MLNIFKPKLSLAHVIKIRKTGSSLKKTAL
jgi:hypothetical protein